MKRSTNVALTLLVPAMAAFGCSRPAPPPPMNQQVAADCQQPAKPGEPAKPKCDPATATGSRTNYGSGSHYRSSHGSWFGPIFGGSSYRSSSPVTSHGATSHGTTSTSHTSGSSSVSHGGFGSSGAHFSGGS
ncbi:MAG: hypothetical protein NT013_17455 [Planctomycetia bacterium]|nr:hypothetical protein [Planctomycetia bacterium]